MEMAMILFRAITMIIRLMVEMATTLFMAMEEMTFFLETMEMI